MKKLFRVRIFWLFVVLMICSGASEQAMGQWSSYFAETGLGVGKTLCDLLGPCMFAVLMGTARVVYSAVSNRISLKQVLIASGLLAGDVGCASGPSLVGLVPDLLGGDLRFGILAAMVFPTVLVMGIFYLGKKKNSR